MNPQQFVFFYLSVTSVLCDHHQITNQLPDRSTIVHLFEWKWSAIADECERFLGPKGFGGVQISPPSENLIIHTDDGTRPWWERYQVMSYILKTRSGHSKDFQDMTRRCNQAGVRIYADIVVNHMTADHISNVGTAGSKADFTNYHYPAVPYTIKHFHYPHCSIDNYNNASEVRNCQLLGLKDLDQSLTYVRDKIISYLNMLIHLGVAGFRIDAAKHMSPKDLKKIYERLHYLNPQFGFGPETKPYIYHEVVYYGNEAIKPSEYTGLGDVTEFRVCNELKAVFRGKNAFKWLVNWGEEWGLSPSETALAFIDNHDTQRSSDVLTYKEPRAYKAAIAFMHAHTYGEMQIMSSYFFESSDQGPPSYSNETIMSPSINKDDTCGNGWVCEHRWRQIYQMVGFRNAVKGTNITNWWSKDEYKIAFSRGNKGFIVFNLEKSNLVESLQIVSGDLQHLSQPVVSKIVARISKELALKTGLPEGEYCDVVSGKVADNACTGVSINVDQDGNARIQLLADSEDMFLAIHVGAESSLRACELSAQSESTPELDDEELSIFERLYSYVTG